MDLNHVFTVQLSADEAYEIALLENASITTADGKTSLTLPWIDITGEGDDLDEAIESALGEVNKRFQEEVLPYIKANARQLSSEEIVQNAIKSAQEREWRQLVAEDEEYMIALLKEAKIERVDERWKIDAAWVGITSEGDKLNEAVKSFIEQINVEVGEVDSQGPKWDVGVSYTRENGTRIPLEQLVEERAAKTAYEAAKVKIDGITPDDIDALSRTGVPVLIDFWAEWCGPCRLITPVLADLQDEWAGKMLFKKINVDNFEGIWAKFGIEGIPTMIVYRDGEEIHRAVGFGGREALVTELEGLLVSS